MALDDPFSPTVDAAAQRPQTDDLQGQWMNFLSHPVVQSSLLSAGLQMMQPIGFGQTPAGHVAQAIGAGGESVARSAKQAQEEEALALKGEAEDRRASAEERRLSQGERRLNLTEMFGKARIGLARERLDKMGQGLTANQKALLERREAVDMQRAADAEAKAIDKKVNEFGVREQDIRPEWKKYKGRNFAEISADLQKDPVFIQRYRESARGRFKAPIPQTPDTEDDDEDGDQGDQGEVSTSTSPDSGLPIGTTATNKTTGRRVRWNGKGWEYL